MIHQEGVTGLAFTFREHTEIVLIKRQDCGMWFLPGGGIEKCDSKEEAVMREVKEETGLDMTITRGAKIYDFKVPRRRPFFWNRQYVFCGVAKGQIKANEEAEDIRFFPIDNLPKGLPYWQKEYINHACGEGGNYFNFLSKPYTQTIKIRGLVSLLTSNPQLLKTPSRIFRKLTESSKQNST